MSQAIERVGSAEPSVNQPNSLQANLPSWAELAQLVKKKLLAWIAQCKSKLRVCLGISSAILCLSMLPWPFSIQCKVVFEPVVRRYVAAPFDAKLHNSNVVVGQQVKQGDLLATLDGSDIRSQIASVHAKLAQAEQRELAALSTGDHSKAGIEHLEVEHLRREAELLERRHANLEILAPIDGVVVTGDLERAAGAPLSIGDNMFEVACLDQFVAEIAIPEQDILFVEEKMPVVISMDAIPGARLESTIRQIHLRNEIRDDTSVFVAVADLPNDEQLLRPGMNARASIAVGYRPVGWQLFRRPINAARQWAGW